LLYAPGFWWATAAVGSVVDIDLTAARIISALALVGPMACLFDLARQLTGDWRYGALAAGLYAATLSVAQGRATIGAGAWSAWFLCWVRCSTCAE
jgi:hypothetical protein